MSRSMPRSLPGDAGVPTGAATVILFTLITATHVLSAVVALFVITALTLTRQLKRPTLLLLCLLVFVAWQAYAAAPFYEFYGHRLLQTVFAAITGSESLVAVCIGK